MHTQIVDCFEKSATLRRILCKKVEDTFTQLPIDFDSILTWDYWPIVITAIRKFPDKLLHFNILKNHNNYMYVCQ